MATQVNTLEALLLKINTANGTSLTYRDVAVEQVQATTTAEANANGGANTKAFVRTIVKLVPTMKGGTWVYYNRVPLATAFINPTVAIAAVSDINATGTSMWNLQKAKFGLAHAMRDLAPQILGNTPQTNLTYGCVAANNSVGYTGTVTLTYNHAGAGFISQDGDYGVFRPGKVGQPFQSAPVIWAGASWSSVTTSGAVPPGLTVSQITGQGAGQNQISMTGTPTTPGTYTFTYTLQGLGTSQSRTVIIHPATVTGWATQFNGAITSDGFRWTLTGTDKLIGKAKGAFDLTTGTKKWYFQFDVYWVGGDNVIELGLCDPDLPLDGTWPSDYAGAWMVQQFTGEMRSGGQLYPGALLGGLGQQFGGLFWHATAIGMAVDATDPANVKVWIRPNGSYPQDTTGAASNPATGAAPTFVFDSKGKSLFPCAGATFGTALGTAAPPKISLRMSSLDWQSSAPAGFASPFTT
jgi:hypothetical protein